MKLTRAQFLKTLPAAALVLAGCTAAPTAPADTDELVFDHAYPLDYATQFTADCYADGSTLLTIPDAQVKFLVRPEGAATLRAVPEGVTVLQQPVQNIYLVSTSAMDLFLHLDALDSIALSGTRAEGWYLDEAKQAMQAGRIAYAGKYSAPDYERILTAECGLAVENTMIYHTLLKELYTFMSEFEGDVPGACARDCGNYLDMNLPMAKYLSKKYLTEVLENISEERLVYPE